MLFFLYIWHSVGGGVLYLLYNALLSILCLACGEAVLVVKRRAPFGLVPEGLYLFNVSEACGTALIPAPACGRSRCAKRYRTC